jgi:hypothetical protein
MRMRSSFTCWLLRKDQQLWFVEKNAVKVTPTRTDAFKDKPNGT